MLARQGLFCGALTNIIPVTLTFNLVDTIVDMGYIRSRIVR